jgi:hypothetical protein
MGLTSYENGFRDGKRLRTTALDNDSPSYNIDFC